MATFKDSFRAARKSGKKEFSWNGKKYNTKLKEDSSIPTPTARPERRADKATSGASRSTDNKVKPKAKERQDYPRPLKEKQDYPRDSRSVGIARKGSVISKAVARRENKPKSR